MTLQQSLKNPPEVDFHDWIAHYRLDRRLGSGGMAEVYAAMHVGAAGFQRPVCLKRIHPHLANDLEFRKMFMHEAQIAGQLLHSNIVQVFDCIEDGPELALVMELVEGIDLKELLRELNYQGQMMPHGLVAYITGQILCGLLYAHEKRIVHRDISPHNILVSRYGEVKLADFGVAQVMRTHATRTNNLKGKLAYMSPEQFAGKKSDERTDLYSTGLVLYELLAGKRFFPRSHSGLIQALKKPPVPELEGVQSDLASVIRILLSPNVEERFRSAEEALYVLPAWEALSPIGSRELAKFLRQVLENTVF